MLQFPDSQVDPGTRSASLASDADSSENGDDFLGQLPEPREGKPVKKHTRYRVTQKKIPVFGELKVDMFGGLNLHQIGVNF